MRFPASAVRAETLSDLSAVSLRFSASVFTFANRLCVDDALLRASAFHTLASPSFVGGWWGYMPILTASNPACIVNTNSL